MRASQVVILFSKKTGCVYAAGFFMRFPPKPTPYP